jgi:hypothetical protein
MLELRPRTSPLELLEVFYVLLLETLVRSSGLLPVMDRLMKQCLKHHIFKCRAH